MLHLHASPSFWRERERPGLNSSVKMQAPVRTLLVLFLVLLDVASSNFHEVVRRLAQDSIDAGRKPEEVWDDLKVMLMNGYSEDMDLEKMKQEVLGMEEDKSSEIQCNVGEEGTFYADRHVKRVLDIMNDEDCLSKEFDVNDPKFDPADVSRVFAKCRLVVVRNLYNAEQVKGIRQNLTQFITGVNDGTLPKKLKTTLGENSFYVERGTKRFELVVPRYAVNRDILVPDVVKEFLHGPGVFGDDPRVLSTGALMSEPGCKEGDWHTDDGYLIGETHYDTFGIAGQDLPPFAMNMISPLLSNITHLHGPTEFCLGSTNFGGLRQSRDQELPIRDESLLQGKDAYVTELLYEFMFHESGHCPPQLWRAPLVNPGDAIFFDYNILHRGGANLSPDTTRALFIATYCRSFYRDDNFDGEHLGAAFRNPKDKMTESSRFAALDEIESAKLDDRVDYPTLESISNWMRSHPFRDYSRKHGDVTLWVSNVDIPDATLYADGENITPLLPHESAELTVEIGCKLILRSSNGLAKTWIVTPDSGQLFGSQSMAQLETKASASSLS